MTIPCPRKCADCEGDDHHWMVDCDDETGGPMVICKHCDATREFRDSDLEE